MVIPFAQDTKDDFCTWRRLRKTLDFIEPLDFNGLTLDVGSRNLVGEAIELSLGKNLENTFPSDFNNGITAPRSGYHTILCFEVLEHVMNPLLFLQSIASYLHRGGVLYLSTPVHNRFGFMFNETDHVAEYKESVVRIMLESAGFKIRRSVTFRSIPLLRGWIQGGGLVRTPLRILSQRTQIYRAMKT